MTTTAATPTQPHQALYRRWRAQTFAEIVGQTAVVETLRNAVRSERVAHAILFVGPRGTGKTSLARILAKALNCTNLQDGDPCDRCEACVAIREGRAFDLVEIDAASNRGIADIRDLRERINYAPTDLRRKVYILDEAHQITKDAWNALLKSLEEPPDFVTFMFASTHPQDFPPAIVSRLQRFDVRRLTVPEIEGKLQRILAAEGVDAEPAAVHLVARLAAGGMRDAESMLDQLLSASGGQITEAGVRDLLGLAEAEAVDRLVTALADGDAAAGIAVLDELEDRGRDLGIVLDQAVELVRTRLAASFGGSGDPAATARLTRAARSLAAIDPERRGVGGLRLQVELALIAAPPASSAIAPQQTAEAPRAAPAKAVPSKAPTPPAEAAENPATTEPLPLAATESPPSATAATAPEPAPAAEPAPEAPAAAATAADPDLDRLLRSWPEIVTSVRPATRAVITECRPMSVDGNVVTLGFPEAKAFLKDIAERKRSDLEEAVGGFLRRAVSVRCVATNVDLVAPLAADDEAGRIFAEARRIFEDDLVDVGEVT
ncbi:MAG TPA: DNA polymerase III subunit gamma/tau [Candidatus Limnocylindrales bacterium]|nr:DNA polymerase III subunit gamma/tau [Candidatus Limnocylindrales bacterium]